MYFIAVFILIQLFGEFLLLQMKPAFYAMDSAEFIKLYFKNTQKYTKCHLKFGFGIKRRSVGLTAGDDKSNHLNEKYIVTNI